MGVLERFSLEGRIALVTAGAGPLFGQSLSAALAEAGATVLVASRSLERNQQFARELASRTGAAVHALELDICSAESIRRLGTQVLERFGHLDVLVNNALARDGHAGRLDEQTFAQSLRAAAGDFAGLIELCLTFLPSMTERRSGSIINIGSIYGVVSNDPNLYAGCDMVQPPTYNFVKGGMVALTKYLAAYCGKSRVRVNCISPGGYFHHQPPAFVERYCQHVPLGRMANAEDVQGAVVFLASDAAQYVTGINLLVDGGWTCL